MLIRVDTLGSASFGIQITDRWGVASEYGARISSLNNAQAKPDAHGLFTFVISAKDPGVINWLDSGGYNSGIVTLRWQGVPQGAAMDLAIRDIRLLKLSALDSSLSRVSPSARKEERRKRARDYAVRLTR
jgi:hypothetical protein